ncbi:DUF4856 domain-containing protein [Marivirga tractuosa]|uniref:DUF4856 domain-containing protein n=1 Tax=Marivirga tractuosa (strain ATCC 23168 / DSM 4126 / NBRC 15989 / NCIMB 1408 / VKM B-1430 / H-43) TaxID=643867 RepID=E4TMD7_MARTH|nr:DUF4856 domain-containing protein [Marivirga tractuosa]ADR22396.1 hypothetical protein Ftrac_2418 [Marivirga tractuosa DSM 4126]BDD16933.1 DUF4856 domain-containing protein [Marivirga tractuosa]
MKNLRLLGLALLAVFAFTACDDENTAGENEETYEIPSTYDFENVSYSGQTQRLDMLEELTVYMKTANEGAVLDAQSMLDMYANENNAFSKAELNESTKQLENKTVESDISKFQGFIREFAAATAEANGGEGSDGTPGVVTSNDGSKQYFFDANGLEHIQLIEKGLMGSCFYFQGVSIYLGSGKMDVDNETIEAGKGTAMEHHWDEAFGYFGVPTDFPSNTDGIRFWGKYANGRDALLGSNEAAMNAFIKGRAAISNKDLDTRDEQIEIIRNEWEKVSAATAIHYLNEAIAGFADDAIRNHTLSEAWAFIHALKYNPNQKVSNTEVQSILDELGTNFYQITTEQINAAKATLVEAYGFEDIQDQL